jgi:hypothetical protein
VHDNNTQALLLLAQTSLLTSRCLVLDRTRNNQQFNPHILQLVATCIGKGGNQLQEEPQKLVRGLGSTRCTRSLPLFS